MKQLFKVEKNIKTPMGVTGELSKFLLSLTVGDSFSFPKEKHNTISNTANRLKGQGKINYMIRSENSGYRLWITEPKKTTNL